MNRAVEPVPGLKSDLEIFTSIAKRIGIDNYNEKTTEEWLEEILKKEPGLPDLRILKEADLYKFNIDTPEVAFKKQIEDPDNHPFSTPSGKIEIFSNRFNNMENPLIPPIPKYIPPWEGPDDNRIKDYPIQLITPHSRIRINSQLDNIEGMKKSDDDYLWINPVNANKRNIADGDTIYVYNDRGRIRTKVKVTGKIMPGVASMDQGKWYDLDERGIDNGGSVNVLTLDRMSPTGAFTSNTCLVQVEKI